MTDNASSPRPRKRARVSRKLKNTSNDAAISGDAEPRPRYVPRSEIGPIRPRLANEGPIEGVKTSIVSRRYRNNCGNPIFTIRLERINPQNDNDDPPVQEKEVYNSDIEDFVSKWELERFETEWVDPDEVMPGIVIGAPGFEKTQTRERPGSSMSEDSSQPSTSTTRKFATREFVDMLSPRKRRPPMRTAAVMGIGPNVDDIYDGHQSSEGAYEFDADVEDEVDPANFRGIGGYVIPTRRRSAMSSQSKAETSASNPRRKPPAPDRSFSASGDTSAMSGEEQEPEKLLMGFRPHQTRVDREHSSAHASASTFSSAARPRGRGRGRGRAPRTALSSSASSRAHPQPNPAARGSTARKSSTNQSSSPENDTNNADAKAVHEGREEREERVDNEGEVWLDTMPARYESDQGPTKGLSSPPPASSPEVERQPESRPQPIFIDLLSDSESDVPPPPSLAQQLAENEREAAIIRADRAIAEVAMARARKYEEDLRRAQDKEDPYRAARSQQGPPAPAQTLTSAHEQGAYTLAPAIPSGASAETAICIDDDDDEDENRNDDHHNTDRNRNHEGDNGAEEDDDSITYDDDGDFHFSSVIDHKRDDNGVMVYLVKWDEKPHPPEDWSWYPEDELGPGSKTIIENYIREIRKPSSPASMAKMDIILDIRPNRRRGR